MNQSQTLGMQRLSPRYLVDLPRGELRTSLADDAVVDWEAEFGTTGELMVEIGSGTGDALLARAQAHPDARLVAFEVYEAAVASTLLRLESAGVDNVRILMVDGVQGLELLFPAGSIAELCVYFPDPWHKKRHHKRRLITPQFASLATSRLSVGGMWRMATDWQDYADEMLTIASRTPGLTNVHDGWAPRPDERPITRFEGRGLQAGRAVRDLAFRRVS